MTFNTISNNSQINVDTKIINKGFLILDELFQKHGWHLIKNEMNWTLTYTFETMMDEMIEFWLKTYTK